MQVDAFQLDMAEQLLGYRFMENGRFGIVIREFFGVQTEYSLSVSRTQ